MQEKTKEREREEEEKRTGFCARWSDQIRDVKLANQFENKHPTSCFNVYSFSKSQKRDLLNHSRDTLTFRRSAVTISFDLAAQRIDLPLLSGISNTEKTRNFSLNFPLELRFQERRSSWDESPFPFGNFKKLSFGLCDLFHGLRLILNFGTSVILKRAVSAVSAEFSLILWGKRLAREIVESVLKTNDCQEYESSVNNTGNEINMLNYCYRLVYEKCIISLLIQLVRYLI